MEDILKYKNLLIAGGASTVSHSVVWLPGAVDKEEIVAFLCDNHIQVYERRSKRVELSLRSQEERLDCISGIYLRDRNVYVLLSGSAKGVINVWVSQSRHPQGYLQWKLHQSFTFPSNAAVSSLAVTYVSAIDTLLIAAADAKGQVQIYRSSPVDPNAHGFDMELSFYQKLAFPTSQLPKSLKFAPLVHDTLALVVGGVDSKVHLFVHNISTLSTSTLPGFRGVGNLWGHEEWVTCLDAINVLLPSNDGQEKERQEATFIASGSQDNKIRIWKVVGKAITPTMAVALGFGSDDTNDAATPSTDNNNVTATTVYEDDEDDDEDDDLGGGDGEGNSGNKNTSSSKAVIDTEDIQDAEARLTFTNQDRTMLYQVFLESLLLGHEDWVTSLAWMPIHPTVAAANNASQHALDLDNLALFSTSMDRNMVVWCPNASMGGVWTPLVRVGDVGGALGGSIGGNLLGFVSGCAAPDGQCVIGIGYGGSFHCWARTVDPITTTTTTATTVSGYQALAESRWIPKPFVSGHFDHVTSLSWASAPTTISTVGIDRDDFLLTASADQTCRLYAPIVAQDPHFEQPAPSSSPSSSSSSSVSSMWREIARPLIHGYNINAVVPRRFGSAQILVASDEKLIRHFIMSRMVQESLSHLAGIDVSLHPSEVPLSVDQAYIPELGLSNKPKESMNSQEQKEQEARNVSMIDWEAMHCQGSSSSSSSSSATTTITIVNSGNDITLERGLLESQLADYTVWLEVNKWYGHAYDVLCLSQVSRCGRFVASACRAKFAQTQHTPLPKASNYDLGQAGGLGILVWELPLSCMNGPTATSATTTTTTTTSGGEIIARLEEGHEMSVVSLEFSPNGRYLASCGKDRSICLHVQEADPRRPGRTTFTSVVAVKNAHKRIIWDASWTADSRFLLTGSRDGALKIWTVVLDAATQTVPVDLRCVYSFTPFARFTANPSVTALDVYQYPSPSLLTSADDILVVVGSGAGEMQVLRLRVTDAAVGTASNTEATVTVDVLCEVPHEQAHSATVRKVMWRRPIADASSDASSSNASSNASSSSPPLVWASCSEDHTARIHQLALV